MSKTILIPTDFSIESLNLLKEAARAAGNDSVRMVLVHGVYLPGSMMELLFFSKRRLIEDLSTKDFKEACRILHNKYYSQIETIQVELFTGSTQAAFQTFIEAMQVDRVFVPADYVMRMNTARSFDPVPFIRRSGLPLTEVTWKPLGNVPEKDLLAGLFHQELQPDGVRTH